jgi:Copper chaperone PCu(A)C
MKLLVFFLFGCMRDVRVHCEVRAGGEEAATLGAPEYPASGSGKEKGMGHLSSVALVLALAAIATPALAQEFKAGDITIDKSWARATPKGAEVGAGYFVVHNSGETPDRLTGGSADFARLELHEMKTENGVMTMPELKKRPRHSRTRNRSVHAIRLMR